MSKTSDSTWTYRTTLPSICGAGEPFLAELLAALRERQWSAKEIFGIHLAVEEALVNAIRHGNGSNEAKQVYVTSQLDAHRLFLEIADEGEGFDPGRVPDCTEGQNLQRPNGRGIMLMRKYMSRVEYIEGGHRVIMEKRREAGG